MSAMEQDEVILKPAWQLWEAVTLGLVALLSYFSMLLFLTPVVLRNRPPVYLSYYQTSLLTNVISLTGTFLVIAPTVRLLCPFNTKEFLSSVGWNSAQNFRVYAAVIAAGASLALAMHSSGRWFGGLPDHVSRTHLLLTFLLYFFSSALLGPILEELYFRGVLFVSLSPKIGRLGAILVVTVLFAMIHAGHQLGVLPIAALLGFVRLRTDSLASCFALHAAYNLFLFCFAVK